MTQSEFTRRVLDMEGKLYRVSLSMLKSDAVCKDVTQGALVKAWLCHDRLRDQDKFEGWLIRILVSECKGLLRRQGMPQVTPSAPDAWGQDLRVRDALFQLDDRLRMPVMLHYVEGYGVDEIAHMLGARPGAVKRWLDQGREALRALLGEGGDRA